MQSLYITLKKTKSDIASLNSSVEAIVAVCVCVGSVSLIKVSLSLVVVATVEPISILESTSSVSAEVSVMIVVATPSLLVSISLLHDQHALFFGVVHDFIWQTQVLDVNTPDIHLWYLHETVTGGIQLNDIAQGQVHPRIAIHQVTVERFTIFQLYQHRLRFCRR